MQRHGSRHVVLRPPPPPLTLGWGHKVKIQLIQNMVMLHIKLKGWSIEHHASIYYPQPVRGVPEGNIKVRRGWVWEGVCPSHTLGKKIKI